MFEDEFLHEEAENNPPPTGAMLTVLGWLQIEFGARRGNDIYTRMKQAAEDCTAYRDLGGAPGILFTADGGEFVSLDDAHIE